MCVKRALYVFLFISLIATSALSQTFRGGIAGSVADPSGSMIAGASVKIVHNGTGLTRSQVTSNAGDFSFDELPTGIYKVTVTQAGFQPDTAEIEVAVGK